MVVAGTFSLATGQRLNLREEWGPLLFQALLVAAPFGLLSLSGINSKVPWLVGVALTVAFWGYYLVTGVRYQLSDDRSGVDFGLAFAMLFSPLVIFAICFAVAKAGTRGRP